MLQFLTIHLGEYCSAVKASTCTPRPDFMQNAIVACNPASSLTHDKHSIVQGIAQAAFVAVLQHEAHLQQSPA
jgi:hypothetical protein